MPHASSISELYLKNKGDCLDLIVRQSPKHFTFYFTYYLLKKIMCPGISPVLTLHFFIPALLKHTSDPLEV